MQRASYMEPFLFLYYMEHVNSAPILLRANTPLSFQTSVIFIVLAVLCNGWQTWLNNNLLISTEQLREELITFLVLINFSADLCLLNEGWPGGGQTDALRMGGRQTGGVQARMDGRWTDGWRTTPLAQLNVTNSIKPVWQMMDYWSVLTLVDAAAHWSSSSLSAEQTEHPLLCLPPLTHLHLPDSTPRVSTVTKSHEREKMSCDWLRAMGRLNIDEVAGSGYSTEPGSVSV